MPDSFARGLRGAVKAGLVGQDWRVIDLAAAEIQGERRPLVERLSDALGLTFSPRLRLDAGTFVENSDLWRRILFIDLSRTEREELRHWSGFFEQHAAASRERPLTERSVVCAVCSGGASDVMPPEDLSFARHWWWGAVSRLDAEVHISDLLIEDDADPVFVAAIVEVSAFDLGVADLLAERWSGDLEELRTILSEYAALSGLDGSAPSSALPRSAAQPPHQLMELWSRGAANRWAELDPCIHSALEVVREGRELETRVWRGQVRTLLPEIEIERQRLSEWVLRHRRELSDYWARQDIAGLEIGPLCKLIRETPSLRTQHEQWELAKWLRDARNSLAHWNVIDGARLRRGRELIERAREVADDVY